VHFDGGGRQEKAHAFLCPLAEEERVMRTLGQLLDGVRWLAPASALEVALEQIQDAVAEQLAFFPDVGAGLSSRGPGYFEGSPVTRARPNERDRKLHEVERYLSNRFGANHLRRVALVQPGAPLPEWRVGWSSEEAQ
jgi:hypothetical protein